MEPAGQDGIKRLIAAEAEAQEIVSKARRAKTERLKQAKAEAEREINAFKAQCDEGFRNAVTEGTTSSGSNLGKLQADMQAQISQVTRRAESQRPAVVKSLVSAVTTVPITAQGK
ncbi:unnamed protein product [Pedinophyceae sp. YPF-701]|nr:unnamed protein product [Pedinophyceae sp. YPF-701]